MVRGLAPATALRGRAAAAARWCTCRRVAVAVCLGNLAAALLVARALYAPGTFASAPKRTPRSPQLTAGSSGCFDQINQAFGFVPMVSGGEAKYSKEQQVRWVEESIRIRRAAEPAELIEAVQPALQQSFYAWDSVCSGVLL